MMHKRIVLAGLLAAGVVGAGSTASASVIVPVANASFESPNVDSTPPFYNTPGPITGWSIGAIGNVGVWAPAHYAPSYTPPDGIQVAYTGYGYAIIYQDVGPVLGGRTYTLSVEVGKRTGIPLGDYRLLLGIGGHDLATTSVFAQVTDPVIPAEGTFALATLTGTAPIGATGDLNIFLEGGQDRFGFVGQPGWDVVKLTVAAPEPATLALFGAGLAGLGALRRRRKAKA